MTNFRPANRLYIPALTAVAIFALGCQLDPQQQPISARAVHLTAKDNLARNLIDLEAAARALEGLKLPIDMNLGDAIEPHTRDADMNVDAIATQIANTLFNEASIEDATSTRITFRLRPENLCGEGTIDDDCRRFLDQTPVRLAVTAPSAGDLDVEVAVGATAPVILRLYKARLEVEVVLSQLKDAVEVVAAAQGETNIELPAIMRGRVAVALVRHGPLEFTAQLSIPSAVEIRGDTEAGPVDFTIGSSLPALALRIDGELKSVAVSSNFGGFDLSGPASLLADMTMNCDEPAAVEPPVGGEGEVVKPKVPEAPACTSPFEGIGRNVAFHLPAFDFSAGYRAGNETVVMRASSLGLDDAYVALDGFRLFEASLNATEGDTIKAEFKAKEDGLRMFLAPGAEYGVRFDLTSLPADRLTEVPSWLVEERIGVRLDGAERPAIRLVANADDGIVAEAISGLLTLRSDALGRNITVPEGSCLRSDVATDNPLDDTPSTEQAPHPFGGLSAGACK